MLEPGEVNMENFKVEGYPSYFIINKENDIVKSYAGSGHVDEIEKDVKFVL